MDHANGAAHNPRNRDGWARFAWRVGAIVPALLGACTPAAPSAEEPSRRVVSLAPSTTELLFAIGAGDRVVGRTRWLAHPPEAFAVPAVGDGLEPNVEAVAAVRPDLVILYDSPANTQAEAHLRDLGIRSIRLSMDRLDDVARSARLLGALTGTTAAAEQLATVFERELDSARAVLQPGPAVRVMILSWDQPPIVIGAGSFLSELLELAGARNAFGDLPLPSGQVSIEAIAARNPDVVLVIGEDAAPAWMQRPEWQVVGAVRAGRVVTVASSAFTYPSVRALTAARELRRALEASTP